MFTDQHCPGNSPIKTLEHPWIQSQTTETV